MIQQDIAVLESGQRVGLALNKFVAEVEGFAPLLEANAERAALVAAIEQKAAAQGQDTTSATLTKDQLREQLAQATATLSARAAAYALSIGDLGLKQALTLSYSDVRYGDAAEDVAHVRALVDRVQALPAAMLTRFRITAALLQAPLAAADAFTLAADKQTVVQSGTRLAGQALPELLTRLRAQLQLLDRLLVGMRSDPDPRWEELYQAFRDANKRREGQASYRLAETTKPRVVRRLLLHRQDGQAVRLAATNYGAAYTLTVENRSNTALLLWMAQKGGAETTPQTCPAGKVTVVTRAQLGPETARYLTARFAGDAGGEAEIVVRRVM